MSKGLSSKALVLSRRDWGEADRLVTLLTEERGLQKIIAKGVRKIPSRRGGHLEPLTEVWIELVDGQSGFYLKNVETVDYFRQLNGDQDAQNRAMGHVRAVAGLITEGEEEKRLYKFVCRSWQALEGRRVGDRDAIDTAVLLLVLGLAGLAPDWKTCASCGGTVRIEEEKALLDPAEGGWRCGRCMGKVSGVLSISGRCLKACYFLATYPDKAANLKLTSQEGQQIKAAISKYMDMTGK